MDAEGRPAADKSRAHEREEERPAVLSRVRVGKAQADPASGRLVCVNPTLCEITGYSEEELLNMTLAEITHAEDRQKNFEGFQRTARGEVSEYEAEERYVRKNGRVIRVAVNTTIVRDEAGQPLRMVATILDITSLMQAENGLRFLAEAGEVLSSSLNYGATLASVARLSVPRLADWCAVDIVAEDGFVRRLAVAHQDPNKVAWAHELQRRYPPDSDALRGVSGVLRTGQAEFYSEITEEMLTTVAYNEEHLELLREIGFSSVIIVPMATHGRVLGTITLVSAESGRRYEEADLGLAEELARRAALAVDNARLYEEMHGAKDELEVILSSVADGITAQDSNGRLVYANEAAARICGYPTAQEMLRAPPQEMLQMFEITDEYGRPVPFEELPGRLALQGERSPEKLLRFRKAATGEERWAVIKAKPIFDDRGRVRLAINVFRDITERKQAEEELRESHTLLRSVVEGANDSVFLKDVRGCYLMVNSACASVLGKPKKEILGKVDSEILPPEVARRLMEIDHLVMTTGENGTYEEQVPMAGGTRTFLTTKAPYRDSQGKVAGVMGIAHDITERKLAEEEMGARSRQQAAVAEVGMRALADTNISVLMNEAVSLVARTLDAEYCKVLELLTNGNEMLLLAGVGWKEGLVGNAKVSAGLDSQAGYTLLSNEPVVVEDLLTESRFNGPPLLHEHGVVSGVSVVVQGREEPFGVLGVHTAEHRIFSRDDVNFLQAVANVLAAAIERKRAEEAFIQVREAERSRIARDIHDEALQDIIDALREIDTSRQLSETGEQGADLEEAANALRRSVAGLRAAIFDLPLAGGDEDGDFVEQIESLVRLNRSHSPDREIELSIEGNLPRSLDRRTQVELQRVLQEALANVRRHSEASRVSMAIGASGGKLWAEVEDDGRGFGPETSAGMGTRGMRERAHALGGSLKIESEPGKGTKVRFEMSLSLEESEPGSEEATRILLVEDHASFREAAAAIFEQEPGFEVVGQAGTLSKAREVLKDGEVEVDVALVDLTLPDGSGGDLIKELRAVDPRAQALVLSATLDRAEVARAVESGATGVLHKSADMNEVMEAVRRVRAGEMLLSLEEVVELLRFAGSQREQEQEAQQAIAQLTPREKEVLQAIAEGLDSKEIAQRLRISATTERNHVANILAKLGVHSRLQALIFAARHGVVELR